MSELKVYRDPKDGLAYREFYEKSEADKVIAEKDAQILDLIERVQKERAAKVDYKISANDLNDGLKKAYEEIDYQKRKRCLAMYRYCAIKALYELDFKGNDVEWKWYSKWMHKWFKLAEKFKEGK